MSSLFRTVPDTVSNQSARRGAPQRGLVPASSQCKGQNSRRMGARGALPESGTRRRRLPSQRHGPAPAAELEPGARAGALAQCWRRPDRARQIFCSPVGLRATGCQLRAAGYGLPATGCGLRAAGFGRSHRRRRYLTAHARPQDPPSRRRGQRAPRSGVRRAGAREMQSRRGGAIGATAPVPGR